MFTPITGTIGGDLGLLVEEIIPEIQASRDVILARETTHPVPQTPVDTCESPEVCFDPAEFTCDDGNMYCADHCPDGVICWRLT